MSNDAFPIHRSLQHFPGYLAHYGGKYSVERMLAFEEYTRNTSLTRVLLVISSPPIFTVVVLLFQESAPLQNPSEGWKANWGFWFRVGVLGTANAHEAITQVPSWLNVPSFTTRQIIVFSVCTVLGLVAGGLAVAEIWVFPIPFFLLSLSLVLSALLIGLMRVVAGGPAFRLIFSRKEESRQLNNVATLETLMCAGYPAYQVLFMKANGTPYELPVILLLSVIKLVMKRVFRSAAAHEEDTIPKLVIFTVDLFNSFYLATFMQRLATMTLVVVMVADIADSAIELRELYLRTQRILARLKELQKPIDNSENFLTAVRALLRNLDSLRSTIHVENRVRSCISHNLSTESRILLDKLDTYSTFGSSASFNQTSQGKTQMPPHFASVVPLPGRAVSLQLFKLGALSTSTPNTIKTAVDSTKESSRLLKSKAPNHRSTAKHQHHPAYRASVVVVVSPVGFRIRDELRSKQFVVHDADVLCLNQVSYHTYR